MKKLLVIALSTLVLLSYIPNTTDLAHANNKPSTRPSTSSFSRPSSSFSRPSTRPSTSSFSRPSTQPSTRPSTRPSSSFSRPSTQPSTRPSTKPSSSPFSIPFFSPSNKSNSSKPSSNSGFDSSASRSKRKQESATIFRPATTPKSSYTTKSGKTIKIDPESTSTQRIRNLNSDQYRTRTTRIERHYHHHYGDRYDHYRTQPTIHVGGGYSSLFWYVMLDWELERRARWLYHNQNVINSNLYQQQLQNAQLRAEIEKLKTKNVKPDPNYVDAEFKENPDLMYSDEYVVAAYNPTLAESDDMQGVEVFFIVVIIFSVCIFFAWLIFIKRWAE